MKNTQDFLDKKNAMLSKEMSKEQVYDTFNRMLRKYNADISDEEFLSKERVLKFERFSLFCVMQSVKADIEGKSTFNISYNKNNQMQIAA